MIDSEAGFGLVELLVSLILMSMIAAASYAIFAYGKGYYEVGDKITDLQQKAHATMDDMTAVLAEGKKIRIPSTSSCATGSTNSMDVISSNCVSMVTYFRNTGGSLLRNNNDGNGNTYRINAADGVNVNTITFTPIFINATIGSTIAIKLRLKLADNIVVSNTGRGNIALVEGAAGECGEDCIELYNEVVPRNRAFNRIPCP